MMMWCSTVYLYKGHLVFHSASQTVHGVWVLSQPVFKIDEQDKGQFGSAIHKVLSASKSNVSHPDSWSGIFDPVLQLTGVKTYAAFMKTAKCLELESDGENVQFIPTINLGPKQGFEQLRDKIIPVTYADMDGLAMTLVKSFDLCG